MNRWIKNGLIIALALMIPVAGFFSLDALYALFPDEKGQITLVEDTAVTPLLYVDEPESLTFYPWTLYNEKETVPLNAILTTENIKELSTRINEAFSSMGHPVSGVSDESLLFGLRYHTSVDKCFLHRYAVTDENGETRYLDVVWDGARFEAMHISPTAPSTDLSNDDRVQYMQSLEEMIQQERTFFAEVYADPVEPIGQSVWKPSCYGRLRDFLIQYNNINRWSSPELGETILPTLLFYGNYHMVFYKGEILLFFMPHEIANTPVSSEIDHTDGATFSGNTTTGLLLYVDAKTFRFNGYSVLDLTV